MSGETIMNKKEEKIQSIKNFCYSIYNSSKYEFSNLLIAIILLIVLLIDRTYISFILWIPFILSLIIRNVPKGKKTIFVFILGIIGMSTNLYVMDQYGYSKLLGVLTAMVVIPVMLTLLFVLYKSVRLRNNKLTQFILTQLLVLTLFEGLVGNIQIVRINEAINEALQLNFNSYFRIFDTYFIFYLSTLRNLFIFYTVFIAICLIYILLNKLQQIKRKNRNEVIQ